MCHKCPLCTIDNEVHNKYFLTLFNASKPLLLPFKGQDSAKISFEEINFSKPFDPTLESCYLSGVYWTLSSLIILNPNKNLTEIIEYDDLVAIFKSVVACSQKLNNNSIGFAPFYRDFYYSPTILHTLHALQIFSILFKYLGKLVTEWIKDNSKALINFLKLHILSNGTVKRTSYPIAVDDGMLGDIREIASLFGIVHMLEKLTGVEYFHEFASFIGKITERILKCKNEDGGYALRESGSSHIGACFCVAAIGNMNVFKEFTGENALSFNYDDMKNWLLSRQTSGGGLSGHDSKPPDVCYSYWFLATLSILNIDIASDGSFDLSSLMKYIRDCSSNKGGFSKRPGKSSNFDCFSILFGSDNNPDPYHSFASLASLLLIGTALSSLCPFHRLIRIDPLTALVTQ